MTPLGWLILANLLGGASYIGTGWALSGFGPLEVVFWRVLVAAALFAPFLRGPALIAEDVWRVAAAGTLGYAVPLLIGTEGQRLSSATLASILVGTEPVSILLLSCLVLGERMTPVKAGAMAAGLAGAALITLQGRLPAPGALTSENWGNFLLALHGFCWSLYTVIGKPAVGRLGAMRFTALSIVTSLVPLCVVSLPGCAERLGLGAGISLAGAAAAGWRAWAAIGFLGAGVGFLGTLAWNKALERVPASRVAHFIFLQPAIGVALGLALERKPLTAWSVAGTALIAVALYAASTQDA